jgi:hypothetical protein
MWMTNRSLYLYPICLIAFVLASGNRSWSADPGLAGPAPAPDRSATAGENDAVDDYIAVQMRKPHIPGLSLAIVRSGQVVKAKGYGFANLELTPTPATVITRIGDDAGSRCGGPVLSESGLEGGGRIQGEAPRLYAEDVQFLFDLKRLGRVAVARPSLERVRFGPSHRHRTQVRREHGVVTGITSRSAPVCVLKRLGRARGQAFARAREVRRTAAGGFCSIGPPSSGLPVAIGTIIVEG